MEADQEADAEQLTDLARGGGRLFLIPNHHPQEGSDGGQRATPSDQHRSGYRAELGQQGRRREDDDEELELEGRADGGSSAGEGKNSNAQWSVPQWSGFLLRAMEPHGRYDASRSLTWLLERSHSKSELSLALLVVLGKFLAARTTIDSLRVLLP